MNTQHHFISSNACFVSPFVPGRSTHLPSPPAASVVMLRVRKTRRPPNWGRGSLVGRFLPLDTNEPVEMDTEFDESNYEGPPSSEYDGAQPGRPKTWSKRSDAARRRWADPAYRKNMLTKREEKKRKDADETGRRRIEIGVMDSITLCDDDKAKRINDYVRSNQLKSEKITAYHRDRKLWMETRLSQGEDLRWRMNRVEYKKQRQDKRQEEARRRHARMRQKLAEEQQSAVEREDSATDGAPAR